MSADTYNVWVMILLGGALAAVLAGLVCLVAAVVGWRSPHRKGRLAGLAVCLILVPSLVAVQQYLQYQVFLPSLGQEYREQARARTEKASVVQIGDAAPLFHVTDTKGKTFDLSEHQGKVVLVNFFATWCGPCMLELPHVQKLWDEHGSDDRFELIVVGREESEQKIAAFQTKQGYTFRMAADVAGTVYSRYAKNYIPRTYLIGSDGKIAYASTGFNEAEVDRLGEEVTAQLAKIKPGDKPRLSASLP